MDQNETITPAMHLEGQKTTPNYSNIEDTTQWAINEPDQCDQLINLIDETSQATEVNEPTNESVDGPVNEPVNEPVNGPAIQPQIPIPSYLKFPQTSNHNSLLMYLGRRMTKKETRLVKGYRNEQFFNKMLNRLHTIAESKGYLKITYLTLMDGNCMFESLAHHIGHGITYRKLRQIVANYMLLFKDYKGFIPNTDISLREMFEPTNEIEYVRLRTWNDDDNDITYYKYTYDIMCQDIANVDSWERLPAQLILLVISFVFKLRINILNSEGFSNVIDAYEQSGQIDKMAKMDNINDVYLGQLGEEHYVPIDIVDPAGIVDNNRLYYTKFEVGYKKWAEQVESMKIEDYRRQQQEGERIRMRLKEYTRQRDESRFDHRNGYDHGYDHGHGYMYANRYPDDYDNEHDTERLQREFDERRDYLKWRGYYDNDPRKLEEFVRHNDDEEIYDYDEDIHDLDVKFGNIQ